jgi:biotin carboxyl carrier protein
MIFEITVTAPDGQQRSHTVRLSRAGETLVCKVDDAEVSLDVATRENGVLSLVVVDADGRSRSYEVRRDQDRIGVNGHIYLAEVRDPRSLRARRRAADSASGPRKVTALMPGKIVRILLAEGDPVDAGQGIVVIEAMKMQNEMRSPKAGIVKRIAVAEGAAVNPGEILAIVE